MICSRPSSQFAGSPEALKEDYATQIAGEGEEFVERILQAGDRMSRLIKDVLQYSRTGRAALKLRAVPLTGLLQQVKSDFNQRLNEIGATLEIPEDLPTVDGDPTLLVQIFTNLFQNAINYRRRDVPLMFQKSLVGTKVVDIVVSVSDNGIGIAPENREKVFQAFHRLHNDNDHPGSGLGLATVKKAVEAMAGTVWLESELDRGTTFFVRLKSQ